VFRRAFAFGILTALFVSMALSLGGCNMDKFNSDVNAGRDRQKKEANYNPD